MTVTAISISHTGHGQKGEQQQQQQQQQNRSLFQLPTLIPCTPTRTLCTHSYVCTRSYHVHPLVPCTPTRTLCTHSYLVHPIVPCAPTRTLCTPPPDESQRGSAFHPEMLPRGRRQVCVLLILTMWMTGELPSRPLP